LFLIAGWLFALITIGTDRMEEAPMGIMKLILVSVTSVIGGFAVDMSAAAG
jgi:hypothetical protein